MSHLVLARKYRPRSFDQVVGQDIIVKTLQAALCKGRVAHAMLFTGGRGIGKTTIARIVAKAMVCLSRNEFGPCGACSHCVSIDNFSSLDVIEIDGASHTGVDDIRELRDSARYQPTSARYKIFIIDEVHMLSISAFNALLKILEEPPEHVVFILATTEAHKIPKTILSRCQRYDFKRVSRETIFAALKNIVACEGLSIEDGGLRLIATLADGSMRDSLSLAEQVFADWQAHYTADGVAQSLGVVSSRAVKDISDALIAGLVPQALLIVKDVYEKGLDLCQLMEAITERFRVLSLCAHVNSEQAALIVESFDESEFKTALLHDKNDLKRLFAMAIDGMSQVFQAQRPLLALELFVLRAALRPPVSDAATISHCLQKLDAIMHNRPLPNVQMPAVAPKVECPQVAPAVKVESAPIEEVKRTVALPAKNAIELLSSLVRAITTNAPALASHLRHARPEIDLPKATLKLYFEQSLHYEQVLAQSSNEIMRTAIKAIFGTPLEIQCLLQKVPLDVIKAVKTVAEVDADIKKMEQKALYERAHNNPLVKKALEIFGGDITEVKAINPDHHAK